jgi:hypothetical protein
MSLFAIKYSKFNCYIFLQKYFIHIKKLLF